MSKKGPESVLGRKRWRQLKAKGYEWDAKKQRAFYLVKGLVADKTDIYPYYTEPLKKEN